MTGAELTALPIADLQRLLRRKEVSPVEALEALIGRIRQVDDQTLRYYYNIEGLLPYVAAIYILGLVFNTFRIISDNKKLKLIRQSAAIDQALQQQLKNHDQIHITRSTFSSHHRNWLQSEPSTNTISAKSDNGAVRFDCSIAETSRGQSVRWHHESRSGPASTHPSRQQSSVGTWPVRFGQHGHD